LDVLDHHPQLLRMCLQQQQAVMQLSTQSCRVCVQPVRILFLARALMLFRAPAQPLSWPPAAVCVKITLSTSCICVLSKHPPAAWRQRTVGAHAPPTLTLQGPQVGGRKRSSSHSSSSCCSIWSCTG
jgi:hypothetical protein